MISTSYPKKEKIPHSSAWNREKVSSALQFLQPLQPFFLDYLTDLLNKYHGWERSPAYYDLLCGEWLLDFSQVIYAAYLEVKGTGSHKPSLPPLPIFADYRDYQHVSCGSREFHQQLHALAAEVLEQGRGIACLFAEANKICGGSTLDIQSRIKRSVGNAGYRMLGKANAPFVFCHPYVKCSRKEWRFTLWKWRNWARQENYTYPVEITARVDADWRCRQSEAISVASFSDTLQALLPLYIPVIYLEGFATYREKAHALNLPRPEILYTATSLHYHMLFKTLAADWREEGTKILNQQNGGGYGINRIFTFEEYETRVSDRFYTLGWKEPSPKQAPLVGAISKSLFYSLKEYKRILLVCVDFPKQVFRIHFNPMPGTIETMNAESVAFVHAMKGRQELVLRPYPEDYGWGTVEALRKANPGLLLDNLRISGIQAFARSALVVHSYLGTSWLETLALNIPTVCFYDTETYAFRDAAKPFIDELTVVGILHQSGSDAARFVLSIKNDIQGWWQRAEVQDARLAFVSNHANFSPDWAQQWEAEFRQWIE